MAVDPKGFLKIARFSSRCRSIEERIHDYKQVFISRKDEESKNQGLRCMDCGTPFCHWGCPLGNYIPEWNQFMAAGFWKKAFILLEATNNMPEITGRICPAICEYACVLGINDDPVTIRENELAIIEYAFKQGWVKPKKPAIRTGKRVAIIGSGPAGIAVAGQLNKAGHSITVFEKYNKIGGIMRYGIPDFKLEKWILDRRINILRKEGIKFITKTNVGHDYPSAKLIEEFDAVCFCGGSRAPRDLKIDGRQLDGIYFALDYLIDANRAVSGESKSASIDAKNKNVVVIGGGDTGSDCVGLANRQGARNVVQIELLPRPPEERTKEYPWPMYPVILKTSSSHEEGCERYWSVLTKKFVDKDGKLKKLSCVEVRSEKDKNSGHYVMKEVPSSEFEIEADLAIIAVGFLHPEHKGFIEDINIKLDKRGNIKTDSNYMSSKPGIFSAGDAHSGQSLIVKAVSEGRKAAHYIDLYLMGKTALPLL